MTARPLADVRAAVLALRRGKGMVLDAADHDTWSAGSFFTNPVLDAAAARLPDGAPRWPQPDGRVKTSAAWLIEHAGFGRGYGDRAGSALSGKHTLALTNRGGATHRGPARARPRDPRRRRSERSASGWSTSRCWSAASCRAGPSAQELATVARRRRRGDDDARHDRPRTATSTPRPSRIVPMMPRT